MIRKIGLVSGVVAALILGVAGPASAGTLDQQQTASNTNAGLFSSQSVAQTFTPGISGRLDQVDLLLFTVGTPPGPAVTVEIRGTSAGSPGAAPLASASIPVSSIGTTQMFLPATFTSPAYVTAGTKYAIVAYSPGAGGNAVGVWDQNSDVYPGGAGFYDTEAIPPGSAWMVNGTSDLAFKTYVAPGPPPATPSAPTVSNTKKCKKHKHHAASAKKHCKKKKK